MAHPLSRRQRVCAADATSPQRQHERAWVNEAQNLSMRCGCTSLQERADVQHSQRQASSPALSGRRFCLRIRLRWEQSSSYELPAASLRLSSEACRRRRHITVDVSSARRTLQLDDPCLLPRHGPQARRQRCILPTLAHLLGRPIAAPLPQLQHQRCSHGPTAAAELRHGRTAVERACEGDHRYAAEMRRSGTTPTPTRRTAALSGAERKSRAKEAYW